MSDSYHIYPSDKIFGSAPLDCLVPLLPPICEDELKPSQVSAIPRTVTLLGKRCSLFRWVSKSDCGILKNLTINIAVHSFPFHSLFMLMFHPTKESFAPLKSLNPAAQNLFYESKPLPSFKSLSLTLLLMHRRLQSMLLRSGCRIAASAARPE